MPASRRPLNVGIAGCGAVTELYYAPALKILERERAIRVSGMFDPDVQSASRIGIQFPGTARVQAFEGLLELDVDLIIVASPPACHAEQTIVALQSGKAVLCEKPLASTLAEGCRMVDAASRTGCILATGFIRRFLPAARIIKSAMENRMLGTMQTFRCFEGGPFQWPVRSHAYFERKGGGGGVLLDIGPHVFDLLGWWLGPPADVRYEDDSMGGVEANCRVRLVYEGFVGEVRLSRDWRLPNRYFFQGSRAWLGWRPDEPDGIEIGFPDAGSAGISTLRKLALESGLPAPGAPAPNFHQSFLEQIRNVVAVVRGQAGEIVSGEDALESMRLIDTCYRYRDLSPMSWFSDGEYLKARQLSNG